LPERNHAVEFVAVYNDGTDSHTWQPMIGIITPLHNGPLQKSGVDNDDRAKLSANDTT
jgi:hypothetical protein